MPVGGEIFRTRPDRPWGPPSLLYNGYRVSFPGVKRPGRGADHPPPSSAEVEGEVELYICFASGPSWLVLWGPLPLLNLNSDTSGSSGRMLPGHNATDFEKRKFQSKELDYTDHSRSKNMYPLVRGKIHAKFCRYHSVVMIEHSVMNL